MAKGLDDIAALPDPVGARSSAGTRPNGLEISRVRVPIGIIGVIYEARPNVTADAGALCIKSGNVVVLRGGSDSFHSSRAIVELLRRALAAAGLPEDCVQLVPTTDRAAVGEMLKAMDWLDLIVPRGGRSLIDRVTAESRVPVLRHYDGICHVYVDRDADVAMARDIVANAKMRRVSVCGAAETLLIDRAALDTHLMPVLARLHELGCEVRGDAEVQKRDPAGAGRHREGLAHRISRRRSSRSPRSTASTARSAISRTYGSQHTESIVTDNAATAERFLREVDSAIVMHNASTQFADGGEFGLGAEIGISTNRMHAARAGRAGRAHDLQEHRARQGHAAPMRPGRDLGASSDAGRAARYARRIGLLGGSFNPAHEGHRHISLEALKRLGLDEVWWLVSPQNPLKSDDGMEPLADPRGARQAARPPSAHPGRGARAAARHALHARHGARAATGSIRTRTSSG